jgi:hypothetical protein
MNRNAGSGQLRPALSISSNVILHTNFGTSQYFYCFIYHLLIVYPCFSEKFCFNLVEYLLGRIQERAQSADFSDLHLYQMELFKEALWHQSNDLVFLLEVF